MQPNTCNHKSKIEIKIKTANKQQQQQNIRIREDTAASLAWQQVKGFNENRKKTTKNKTKYVS